MQEIETLNAVVVFEKFFSRETGWSVLEMKKDDGTHFTAVGEIGSVKAGERLILLGNEVIHPRFGEQFKVIEAKNVPIASDNFNNDDEIIEFLVANIDALRPRTAKKIIAFFGEKALDIFEREPIRLAEVDGVTKARAIYYGKEFDKIKNRLETSRFFSSQGMSRAIATKFYDVYGKSALTFLKRNPYSLCSAKIGGKFTDAEKIARKIRDENSDDEELQNVFENQRCIAAICEVLKMAAFNGSSRLPIDILMEDVEQKFGVSESTVYDVLEKESFSTNFVSDEQPFYKLYDGETTSLCLLEYYKSTQIIREKINTLLSNEKRGVSKKELEEISSFIGGTGIEYSDEQKEAVRLAAESSVFILTGGPGTGKTTTSNTIIKMLKNRDETVLLCAPTGKAAKRLADLSGEKTKTIHRLLGVSTVDSEKGNGDFSFIHNEDNPLDVDSIVIDETSMVDELLFSALLRALPDDCRLILIGDKNQLPSVGAGNVFGDLIDSAEFSGKQIPSVTLNIIFRQSETGLIIPLAHNIINGNFTDLPEDFLPECDFEFIPTFSENEILFTVSDYLSFLREKKYDYEKVQVISLSKNGATGTISLNPILRDFFNPLRKNKKEIPFKDGIFREGDKIIQTSNDYNKEWVWKNKTYRGLFNGDTGIIKKVTSDKIIIDFDSRQAEFTRAELKNIIHSYALTVHKSQGSEYDTVILVLSEYATKLMYRRLLYTAVTRAKKKLIIIGNPNVFYSMIRREGLVKRFTCLDCGE